MLKRHLNRNAKLLCHEEVVAQLIGLNANIERTTNKGITPLILAAMRNQQGVIAQLIRLRANIEAKATDGRNSLMHAASNGYHKVIAELVNLGANIEATDNDGDTPLMYAGYYGDHRIVAYLISFGANANSLNHHGHSVLTLAKGKAKEILSACFSQEATLSDEHWLHHLIRLRSNDELEQNLLDSSKDSLKTLINQCDKHGLTPLDIALATRNVEAIALLLSYGADPLGGRFDGISMASRIPEWQTPMMSENGLNLSLYDKIYEVPENYYLAILEPLFAFKKIPDDVAKYIIKWILKLRSFQRERLQFFTSI